MIHNNDNESDGQLWLEALRKMGYVVATGFAVVLIALALYTAGVK